MILFQEGPPPDIIGPGPCIVAAAGTVIMLGMMFVSWIRKRRRSKPPKPHMGDLFS